VQEQVSRIERAKGQSAPQIGTKVCKFARQGNTRGTGEEAGERASCAKWVFARSQGAGTFWVGCRQQRRLSESYAREFECSHRTITRRNMPHISCGSVCPRADRCSTHSTHQCDQAPLTPIALTHTPPPNPLANRLRPTLPSRMHLGVVLPAHGDCFGSVGRVGLEGQEVREARLRSHGLEADPSLGSAHRSGAVTEAERSDQGWWWWGRLGWEGLVTLAAARLGRRPPPGVRMANRTTS
jgi:hypothetical protein